jgi:hypothetical protein
MTSAICEAETYVTTHLLAVTYEIAAFSSPIFRLERRLLSRLLVPPVPLVLLVLREIREKLALKDSRAQMVRLAVLLAPKVRRVGKVRPAKLVLQGLLALKVRLVPVLYV